MAIGYRASLNVVTLNNLAGWVATSWWQTATATDEMFDVVSGFSHDDLIAAGFSDTGHNPADQTACDPGNYLYRVGVANTLAGLYFGRVTQADLYNFDDALKWLRGGRR